MLFKNQEEILEEVERQLVWTFRPLRHAMNYGIASSEQDTCDASFNSGQSGQLCSDWDRPFLTSVQMLSKNGA